MNSTQQPTAYWVMRDCDDVAFTVLASHSTSTEKAQQYEQETGEPFRIETEYRIEIPYAELPESWRENWHDRVPYSIRVYDVPDYATPGMNQ
jgi:hypothetical protein